MSYVTYIMGKRAIMDSSLLDALTESTAQRKYQHWLSSWRMLHIDGFEALVGVLAGAYVPVHSEIENIWSNGQLRVKIKMAPSE